MKNINIPSGHPSFELKTLVVALNQNSGRPFIVFERNMNELDIIETHETNFHNSDREGGVNRGSEQHNKEHNEKVFLNYFVQHVRDFDAKEKFDRIILIAPQEMKNDLHEKLEKHIADKTEIIPGNFYKSEPLEILEKIRKS